MKFLYFLLILSVTLACKPQKEEARIINDQPVWEMTTLNSQASVRGLYAISDFIIWSSGSGGFVGLSKDGGSSWLNLSISNAMDKDFRDIHAFSQYEAIVMSAGDSAEFYYTSDTGMSWELVYQNYRAGVFFDGLDFWEDGTGLAFSDPVDGQLVFAKSQDFGKTWTDYFPKSIPPTIVAEGGFAASGTSILCIGESDVFIGLGATEKVRIIYSNDKGENWKVIDTRLQTGEYYGIYTLAKNAGGQLLAMGGSFSSPQVGQQSTAILKNRGADWEVISSGMPNVYISGLAFHSTLEIGVAVSTEGSFISYDNGGNWKKFSEQSFNSVMISENQVIAVGGSGKAGSFALRKPAN